MFISHIMGQKQYVACQYCGCRLISPYCSFFSRFPCLLYLLINKKAQLLLQAVHAIIPELMVLRVVIEMSPKQAEGDQQTSEDEAVTGNVAFRVQMLYKLSYPKLEYEARPRGRICEATDIMDEMRLRPL